MWNTAQMSCYSCRIIWITLTLERKEITQNAFCCQSFQSEISSFLQSAVPLSPKFCSRSFPFHLHTKSQIFVLGCLHVETWERPSVTLTFTCHGEQPRHTKALVESSGCDGQRALAVLGVKSLGSTKIQPQSSRSMSFLAEEDVKGDWLSKD